MGIPISNVTRRVVYAASGTGPYNFTFEILANTDVAVYKDDALLTLTTDYTVTINSNGTGYITLTASPTGATQIAIVGNRTIQRTTDFVTGGDFFANTVNDEMDQQTIFAQQNAEGLQRALQAPQTDPTTIDMTLPRASIRANKVLSFDADGNPSATEFIGSNRGNWASGTLYYVRDIIKDTSTSNIWQCVTEHTSSGSQPIGTNADAAKWFLLVDAAAAGASATAAAASASAAATSASNASTSATNAASSASTASTQASNASTSASNAASSATAAASSASTASTQASNAATSATNAANSATSASNSASTATTQATNASNSATSAATSASQASTSASNAASSASTASTQASNAATSATNAANSATSSASSATAAAASAAAAAASFDAFDDIYLGAKSSDPSVDNDGNALTTGDQYFNTSANELRVYNGSTWQAASTVGGTVTSLSVTGATTLAQNPTLSGGTANGVAYLNGSKVLTTGSALTFDGTKLNAASSADGPVSLFGVSNATTGGGSTLNIAAASTQYAFPSVRGDTVLRSESNSLVFGTASEFKWGSTSAEWMRLTSTGLGIGTSSPAGPLHVVGTADQIRAGNGTVTAFFGGSGSNGYTGTLTNHSFLFYTNSAERMRLDTSGNLGLGVTPSAWTSGKALQFSHGAFRNSSGSTAMTFNAYLDTNWKYQNSGAVATMYEQFAGAHYWYTAPSGTAGNAITFTQAMTLDASGNLGVGTTSPANFTGYQTVTANGTSGGIFNTQVNGTNALRMASDSTQGYIFEPRNLPISFSTNGTERARIDSSGNFGIGTSSPSARMTVSSSGFGAAGQLQIIRTDTASNWALAGASSGGFQIADVNAGGATRLQIDSSGNLLVGTTDAGQASGIGIKLMYDANQPNVAVVTSRTTNTYTGLTYYSTGAGAYRFYVGAGGTIFATSTSISAISDATLKENVRDLETGLPEIMALKPRRFDWKNGDAQNVAGFVAQEVEQVLPELVTDYVYNKDEDGNDIIKKSLKMGDILPTLVKAIQEQQAIINQLKADVAALKGA